MKTGDFYGGVIIPTTSDAITKPIISAPLPKRVILPLEHTFGENVESLVSIGERVLTGQKIADKNNANTLNTLYTAVHATISGKVVAIDRQPMIRPSHLKALAITIESDGKDEWITPKQNNDFRQQSRQQLIAQLKEAGIVGLGGAGFPTYQKLSTLKKCHTLIINAVECEPNISCDYALLKTHPEAILTGIEILMHITGANKVYFVIDEDEKDIVNAFSQLNNSKHIEFAIMPAKYTSGTERVILKTVLGIEINNATYASDVGVLCQNVATIKAIYDAIINAQPLISRVITLGGDATTKHQNVDVRLGTAITALIELTKPTSTTISIRANGMMMGIDINDTHTPIHKTTNALFINKIAVKPPIQSCIRCGQCNDVCPINLLPQQLYWYSKSDDIDKALNYKLMDCIECNCCTYVCPSNIPLVSHYQRAKMLHKKQLIDKQKADIARERFEFRQYRLERNKAEKKALMEQKKKELQVKLAQNTEAQAKIAAAIEETKK